MFTLNWRPLHNFENLDYQIPVTQLNNGDMQAAKRDLNVMGVRVGVAYFF